MELWFTRERLLVFAHINGLPISAFDAFANLRCGLAFLGLLVAVKRFTYANVAARAVLAHKAIEQAAVPLAAVAVAVAGLLVKNFFTECRHSVSVLHDGVAKLIGVHRGG